MGAARAQWPGLRSLGNHHPDIADRGLAITLPVGANREMSSPRSLADLRILATSDVHMHITGWDALRDRNWSGRGLDGLGRRIDAARKTAKGACILLDNGDSLQGTPMGDTCAQWSRGAVHPWPTVLDTLNYDAVGLGNHDFDFGVPFLEQVVAQTKVPTLCASFATGAVAGVTPTALLRRDVTCSDGAKREVIIGVTSVLPPQTEVWTHRYLAGKITFEEGEVAARRAVGSLRTQGAQVVVMLCHSGLPACGEADSENFAAALAKNVEGLDAMVMGHTHQRFPLPGGPSAVHGVPSVMPGYGAETLGIIDLSLAWTGSRWQVCDQSAMLQGPLASDARDTKIAEIAAPAIADTQDKLNVELGRTQTGFHSYFDMLQSGVAGALVAQAMKRTIAVEVAGTNLAHLPLIAAVAPMALGGRSGPANYVEVAPGQIRARHIAMMSPYPNAIWAIVLKGADLWAWAERSAAYFAPFSEIPDRLVNRNAPSFNFDSLHGLQAVVDPFRPARYDPVGRILNPTARRVRALAYQGEPVEYDATFLVAVTSYRGAGGGMFPGIDGDAHVLRTDVDMVDALRCELLNGALPDTPSPSVWEFADIGRQRVLIETSPSAADHLKDIAQFDPQVIGLCHTGFLEISVAI